MSEIYTSFYFSANNLLFAMTDFQNKSQASEDVKNKLKQDPSVKAVGFITFVNNKYKSCALNPVRLSMNEARKLVLSISKLSQTDLEEAIQL